MHMIIIDAIFLLVVKTKLSPLNDLFFKMSESVEKFKAISVIIRQNSLKFKGLKVLSFAPLSQYQ